MIRSVTKCVFQSRTISFCFNQIMLLLLPPSPSWAQNLMLCAVAGNAQAQEWISRVASVSSVCTLAQSSGLAMALNDMHPSSQVRSKFQGSGWAQKSKLQKIWNWQQCNLEGWLWNDQEAVWGEWVSFWEFPSLILDWETPPAPCRVRCSTALGEQVQSQRMFLCRRHEGCNVYQHVKGEAGGLWCQSYIVQR